HGESWWSRHITKQLVVGTGFNLEVSHLEREREWGTLSLGTLLRRTGTGTVCLRVEILQARCSSDWEPCDSRHTGTWSGGESKKEIQGRRRGIAWAEISPAHMMNSVFYDVPEMELVLSDKNPMDEFELIQRIGSGTYGDVFKVGFALPLLKHSAQRIEKSEALSLSRSHSRFRLYLTSVPFLTDTDLIMFTQCHL
ncbi:hypothetical protein chiPu_0023221, partial [Chiloscyllium punctatum]|nr:hypothetical protein [Chiloscyllium punctatum]